MVPSQNTEPDVTDASRGIFKDISFWLSSTVPQRSYFRKLIEENGGNVVTLEKNADYRLVDHTKPNLVPGTYSYQFVEKSIRNKKLEDPEYHRVGSSTNNVRPVGSSTFRAKSTRHTFSAEDDQILYDWMKPFEEQGGKWRGNKIYQQLEEKHPNHPWQSWRDRWIKKLRTLPRPVTGKTPDREIGQERTQSSPTLSPTPFTSEDKLLLLEGAQDILNVDPSKEDEAWSRFAENYPRHSAREWKNHFHTVVRPEHEQNQREQGASSLLSDNAQQQVQSSKPSPTRRTDSTVTNRVEGAKKDKGKQPVKRVRDDEESRTVTSSSKAKGKRFGPSLSPETIQRTPSSSSKRKRRRLSPVPPPTSQEQTASVTTSDDDGFETAPQYPEGHPSQRSEAATSRENTVDRGPQGVYASDTEDPKKNEADDEDIRYLDAWIEARVKRGKGAKEHQVIEALHYTSIDLDLAEKILPYVISNKGPPSNMRGVWTEEDDRLVERGNAQDIERLEKKHGRDAIMRRLEHLDEWRNGSDDDSS